MINEDQFHGIAVWRVRSAHGEAMISPHGGQLLSWRPQGFDDVFWCSPTTRQPPQAIRGGVPVCWPYFGRQGQTADAVQHGHARVSVWQRVDVSDIDDGVQIDLRLPEDPRTPLRLHQRIRFTSDALEQSLITTNPTGEPLRFTQALHGYFAVSDAGGVTLEGLDGDHYEDQVRGGRHRQIGDWRLDEVAGPAACDRIYTTSRQRFVLRDPGFARRVIIDTEGSRSLVVWNPREGGSASIGDLPAEGWRHFLCVESANASDDAITLAAGGEHQLLQRVTVSALD